MNDATHEFHYAAQRLHEDMLHVERIKTQLEESVAEVKAAMESLERAFREEPKRTTERLEQMTGADKEALRNRIIE